VVEAKIRYIVGGWVDFTPSRPGRFTLIIEYLGMGVVSSLKPDMLLAGVGEFIVQHI
jgi:hypothetical protein